MPAKTAKTRVSTRGNVALPSSIRHRLGIQAGDSLNATVENGKIVLTPQKRQKKYKVRIIEDPRTGLPVLTVGPNAPILTSERVAELLADFP